MYPDQTVALFVTENLVPVRVHVKDDAEAFERLGGRFGVEWTPTILVVDGSGTERHRVEGFLPVDDLLVQLRLGIARYDLAAGDFHDAERRLRAIVTGFPDHEAAPEALYWSGVARYKATDDASALSDTARAFEERYTASPWAKKASVWAE